MVFHFLANRTRSVGVTVVPRVRDHVVVMAVVGCAAIVLDSCRRDGVVVVTHQYGCGHIGPDVEAVSDAMRALLTHPNVTAAVLVGLGCETIPGSRLADELAASGANVSFVGIQAVGGTASAVERVNEEVDRAQEGLTERSGHAGEDGELNVALLATGDREAQDVFKELAHVLANRECRVTPIHCEGSGATADMLAALGRVTAEHAHIAVTIHADLNPPVASPVVPVLTVSADAQTQEAFADDLDIDASSGVDARSFLECLDAVAHGQPTRIERAGVAEFSIEHELRAL